MVVTAPADAVKFADVAPAGTRTEGGTVRAEVTLLAKLTLVPLAGAAPDNVTVHEVVADAARRVVPHTKEVSETGDATWSERFAVALAPLRIPVTDAV